MDWQKEDKLFENQQLFRTPIVRNGRQATVGYQDVYKRQPQKESNSSGGSSVDSDGFGGSSGGSF